MEWTLHPIRRQPARAAALVGVVFWVSWAIAERWEMPGLAAIAVLVLLVAASPFLLPTRFRMDESGVSIHFLGTARHRPWSELRRYREAQEGVLLSPFGRKNVLDETRGLFLRFAAHGAGDRDAVMTAVRERLPRADTATGPASEDDDAATGPPTEDDDG